MSLTWHWGNLTIVLIQRCRLTSIWIDIVDIDRVISKIIFPISIKQRLYTDSGPGVGGDRMFYCNQFPIVWQPGISLQEKRELLFSVQCVLVTNLYGVLSLHFANSGNITIGSYCLHIVLHDDVIKWKHFPRYWSFVRGIHRGRIHRSPGEFRAHRPVTRSFHVFFDLRLNQRLSKQSWCWWFETLPRQLWRHCNGNIACGSATVPKRLSNFKVIGKSLNLYFSCGFVCSVSV